MELELDPPQPPEVIAAVERALADRSAAPDPWWQAGVDEALRGDGAAAEHRGSGPRIVEP